MEKEPSSNERNLSIENIDFKIVDKTDDIKKDVMDLLHQYPDHFIHGLFEPYAEQDFLDSEIAIAYDENLPLGCLMFNKDTNEFNWLAVKKDLKISKSEIAKKLFEVFYPIIDSATEVHFFVNTPDAQIPGQDNFSGKKFEAARRLYRSMGLEIREENRIENKYGPGSHAYLVKWTPNK